MTAIQILVNEHERILTMIDLARAILKNETGDGIDINDVKSVIDFIQNFADKYHHLKEEDVLFLEMANFGMSTEGGPIAVMMHEHNQGRAYVKQAISGINSYMNGDASAYGQIKQNLLAYCDLLTQHIHKENNILYPMAEQMIPQNLLNAMSGSFEKTNSSTANNEYFDVYLKMVDELTNKYLS